MRVTLLATVVVLGALACGGDSRNARETPPAPPPPAAAPRTAPPPAARPTRPTTRPTPPAPPAAAPVRPGRSVDVRMTGDGRTRAAFEPKRLTIAPGTTVRFINVSGGPHNIAFWPDSIPGGARNVLNNAMPRHIGQLMSLMLTDANEVYEIAFPSNAPKGVYRGYCSPHVKMGMSVVITVK